VGRAWGRSRAHCAHRRRARVPPLSGRPRRRDQPDMPARRGGTRPSRSSDDSALRVAERAGRRRRGGMAAARVMGRLSRVLSVTWHARTVPRMRRAIVHASGAPGYGSLTRPTQHVTATGTPTNETCPTVPSGACSDATAGRRPAGWGTAVAKHSMGFGPACVRERRETWDVGSPRVTRAHDCPSDVCAQIIIPHEV